MSVGHVTTDNELKNINTGFPFKIKLQLVTLQIVSSEQFHESALHVVAGVPFPAFPTRQPLTMN